MQKLWIVAFLLGPLALASNQKQQAAPALPQLLPQEDDAREAADRFLGYEDRIAFHTEYRLNGKSTELLIQFRRDSLDEDFEASARVFELRHLSHGNFYLKPAPCENQLQRFSRDSGKLVLNQWYPYPYAESGNQELRVEFPLKNEAVSGGKLLRWNRSSGKYETVGSVRWTRLTHREETLLENRMIQGWRRSPASLRARASCHT